MRAERRETRNGKKRRLFTAAYIKPIGDF